MKNLINKYRANLKAAGASTTAMLVLTTVNAHAQEVDYLQKGLELMSKVLLLGGGVWTVWGIVVIAMSLNDHNGQQMKDGIFKALGGAMVVAAAAWYSSMNVTL